MRNRNNSKQICWLYSHQHGWTVHDGLLPLLVPWFQESGVCRGEGRRRLDQGGNGWRHHQLIHCWTPTCPCSGVPLLWLRYAYTTRCTGPPIKINGPGSRLHLPHVGNFFSQPMFVKDSVFPSTEINLRWNSAMLDVGKINNRSSHLWYVPLSAVGLCPTLNGLANFDYNRPTGNHGKY